MALLRFPTVRDLYDAFPTAADDVGRPASDAECVTFLRSLMKDWAWEPAVSFCAYMLPRREAIAWGCQSLRRIQPNPAPPEMAALDAAERWVRQPEESLRRAALDVGVGGDAGLPATWMALAAGWSSGSIVPPEFASVRPPPEQTARGVRTGLLIAMLRIPSEGLRPELIPCIENAIKLAEQGAR